MKNWYIVQSHSSFENKVASLIKEEADKAKIADKIEEIIVPTHDVTEVKRGKRIQRKTKGKIRDRNGDKLLVIIVAQW